MKNEMDAKKFIIEEFGLPEDVGFNKCPKITYFDIYELLVKFKKIKSDSEHEIKAETLEKIIEKQEEYIAFLIDLIEIDIKIADVSFEERVKRESEIQALKTT